jgi:hypothetical protein
MRPPVDFFPLKSVGRRLVRGTCRLVRPWNRGDECVSIVL